MRRKISLFTLVIAIAIFAVSVYQLYSIYSGYGKAKNEYNDLSERYVKSGESAGALSSGISSSEDSEWNIDFDALREINPEIVGWISVPACNISYPIVKTEDNQKYLSKTFELKTNKSGAIFMDKDNSSDFSDFNTIIYGHNMKNGSMFGSLKMLYNQMGLADVYPYFEIILPGNEVRRYKIFSYYIDDSRSTSYVLTDNAENDQIYLDYVLPRSIEKMDVEVTKDDNIVTLATCSGAAGSEKRFFVHGVQVEND